MSGDSHGRPGNVVAAAARLLSLEGTVALVTGGGGGIGAAVCTTLAELGATTYISDVSLSAAEAIADPLRARGLKTRAIVMDVTDAGASQAAVDEIVAGEGRLDSLVDGRRLVGVRPAARRHGGGPRVLDEGH